MRKMPEPYGACARASGSREAQQPEAAEETRPAVPAVRYADEAGFIPARCGMDVVLREGLSLVQRLPERNSLRSNLPMLALPALYPHRPTHGPLSASDPERAAMPGLRRTAERSGPASIAEARGRQPYGFFPLDSFSPRPCFYSMLTGARG